MSNDSSELRLSLTRSRQYRDQSTEVHSPPDTNTAIKTNNLIKEKTS